jgi:hypothetical protein
MTNPSRLDLLELDLDVRLHDLWESLSDFPETLDHEQVGAFLRAAYGAGYRDALVEPVLGSLCRDHGYSIPERAA